MPKRTKKERRRHVRAKQNLTIEHRLYKRKGIIIDGRWQLSTTKDMSLVGILFYSDIPYLIGDIIQLRVTISGALDVFRGFGRVVRIGQRKLRGSYSVAAAFIEENSKLIKTLRPLKTYV